MVLREKNRAQGSMGKIPTLLKLPSPTLSFPVSRAPTPPASYSPARPPPILPIKCFVHFYSARSVKPFLFCADLVLLFLSPCQFIRTR